MNTILSKCFDFVGKQKIVDELLYILHSSLASLALCFQNEFDKCNVAIFRTSAVATVNKNFFLF